MNENLDLCEILKDVPEGTELYCTLFGDVLFKRIDERSGNPIVVYVKYLCREEDFTKEGKYLCTSRGAECVLFPSRDQRDWSKFVVPCAGKKMAIVEARPFGRVLVRDYLSEEWIPAILRCMYPEESDFCYEDISGARWTLCIPYNQETEHLAFTSDKPDKEYRFVPYNPKKQTK